MMLGRTQADDIAEGSVLYTLLQSVAGELANQERYIEKVRDSYFLNSAAGTLLDERCAELPPGGVVRRGASPSSGAVLRVTRSEPLDNPLVIPAGSQVGTSSGTAFQLTVDAVIPAGDAAISGVHVVSTSSGEATNADIGAITEILDMPTEIVSVSNPVATTNGADRESDAKLINRATLYLSSLARTTPRALEWATLSFIASDGSVFRYAAVAEDPFEPGVSRVYVDDGSGTLGNNIQDGAANAGSVPDGEYATITHEYPATAPLTGNQITVTRNGVVVEGISIISLPERGIAYVTGAQAGDIWTVDNYQKYVGILKELQDEIEGNVDSPDRMTGFRAAGCRVLVVPVASVGVRMRVVVKAQAGRPVNVLQEAVRTRIHDYLLSLDPGEEMIVSRMTQQCLDLEGLADIQFFKPEVASGLTNVTPDARQAIRPDALTVTFMESI
tara:strand:+ start:3619 stop:4950 length:1332 start_codon:yes stop_codon:yes gene_type:complete